MNEFTHQPYEELLNAYVDGELDPSLEQELFEHLAKNPELRATLRQMQSIRSATRNYASAFTPPTRLTARVFSSLGMKAPVATVAATHGSMFSKLLPLAGKFWFPATLAVVATGVTAWFAFHSAGGNTPAAVPVQGQEQHAAAPSSTARIETTTIPTGSSSVPFGTRMISKETRTDHHLFETEDEPLLHSRDGAGAGEASNPVPVGTAADPSAAAAAPSAGETDAAPRVTEEAQAPPAAAAREEESRPADALSTMEAGFDGTPAIERSASSEIGIPGRLAGIGSLYGLPSLPVGMSVQYRAFSAVTSPSAATASETDPLFNNMAVGVLYRVGNEDEIGLEFGQQSFPQQYNGMEGEKHVRYEQNLMTSWLNALYRHQFRGLAIGRAVVPFLSLQAGATMEGWPMMRGSLGAQITPLQNVKFLFGLEGGSMLYPFQQTWFSSRSVGLTYGVSVGF